MFLSRLRTLLWLCCALTAHHSLADDMVINRIGSPQAMQDFDSFRNQRYNAFFDLGSWHGFLLPEQAAQRGSFSGPLIVAEEYAVFLASALDTLHIVNRQTQTIFDNRAAHWTRGERNGELWQTLQWPNVELRLQLRFVSAHTALVKTQLFNRSAQTLVLQLQWQGELLSQWQTEASAKAERKMWVAKVADKFPTWRRAIQFNQNQIIFQLGRLRAPSELMFSGDGQYWIERSMATTTQIDALSYRSLSDDIQLPPQQNTTIFTAHRYALDKNDLHTAQQESAAQLSNAELLWQNAESRWQILAKKTPTALARKAISTLFNNWRHPAGALAFDGVVPSTTSRWFNCQWGWDSYKHAYALAHVDVALAKNQLRAMLAAQITHDDILRPQDQGMIIDDICYNTDPLRGGDGFNWNERNSKPPLITWAAWEIYQQDRDIAWLTEVYPKLMAFHQWWYRNRDHNHNGLVEFGATQHPEHNNERGELKFFISGDDAQRSDWQDRCKNINNTQLECYGLDAYKQALAQSLDVYAPAQEGTGYESGMDNAARFGFIDADQLQHYADQFYAGNIKMARNDWQVGFYENRDSKGALLGYSMDQESVDLNAFLYADKLLLAKMAQRLNKNTDADKLSRDAKRLKTRINQCFFDPATQFYYDRKISDASQENCSTNDLLTKRGKGSESFAVLWSGVATKSNAHKTIQQWLGKDQFNTFLPFPTAAKNNPAYAPKEYWRGRVWLDQYYFALKGLQRYGYQKQAKQLAKTLIDHAQGIQTDAPLRENYNPETGEGLGPANFSWSAAHLLMIEKEILLDKNK